VIEMAKPKPEVKEGLLDQGTVPIDAQHKAHAAKRRKEYEDAEAAEAAAAAKIANG
jgi:hypothetical protein